MSLASSNGKLDAPALPTATTHAPQLTTRPSYYNQGPPPCTIYGYRGSKLNSGYLEPNSTPQLAECSGLPPRVACNRQNSWQGCLAQVGI
jgi:hypothetical protein